MTTNTLLDVRIKVSPALHKKFLDLQDKLGLDKGELVKLAISKLSEQELDAQKQVLLGEKLLLSLTKTVKSKKQPPSFDDIEKIVQKERDALSSNHRI